MYLSVVFEVYDAGGGGLGGLGDVVVVGFGEAPGGSWACVVYEYEVGWGGGEGEVAFEGSGVLVGLYEGGGRDWVG